MSQVVRLCADNYIKQHFREVVDAGEEFFTLTSEQVVKLICSDNLMVPSEEKVFECVMSWILYDISNNLHCGFVLRSGSSEARSVRYFRESKDKRICSIRRANSSVFPQDHNVYIISSNTLDNCLDYLGLMRGVSNSNFFLSFSKIQDVAYNKCCFT